MTPREFSADSVLAKLEHLSELLDVLEGTRDDLSLERVQRDAVLRLAVERIVTQLVELAASANAHVAATIGKTQASGSYRQSFVMMGSLGIIPTDLAARLALSAGMRNIMVHSYGEIDWELVLASIPGFDADYRAYVAHLSRWLADTVV